MYKIINILNKNNTTYAFPFFSLTLFFFGTTLIISSLINILLSGGYFNNPEVSQLNLNPSINVKEVNLILEGNINKKNNKQFISKFVVREDLSIKDLSISSISLEDNGKNSLSAFQSISLSNSDPEVVALNKKISVSDLQKLPSDFNINLLDAKTKKEKFISSILPVVVRQNEEILNNRKKLLAIRDYLVINKTLGNVDQQFLESLASKYNINTVNKHKIDTIEILLESVDEIPNSIVLAQAANESGWGTSRFAKEFNALFGEYTFDTDSGVAPISRNEGEKHLIKFFPNIDESIKSYFNNLNTHTAYKKFRSSRRELREINLELDPMILVKYLKPYAKDKNYVKNIKSIIKTNQLSKFDSLKIITTKS